MTTIDDQVKLAINDVNAAQAKLGTITRADPEAREQAKREVEAALQRLRDAKEAAKVAKQRAAFAGIGSPLHEAIVARLDVATVSALEADALRRQDERDHRAAERRAAKAPAPAPTHPALAADVYRRGAP